MQFAGSTRIFAQTFLEGICCSGSLRRPPIAILLGTYNCIDLGMGLLKESTIRIPKGGIARMSTTRRVAAIQRADRVVMVASFDVCFWHFSDIAPCLT
jgi:hypothetical protein